MAKLSDTSSSTSTLPSSNMVPFNNKRQRTSASLSLNSKPSKLSGDTCGHCNKECTSEGELSKAIQCDLCYAWVHEIVRVFWIKVMRNYLKFHLELLMLFITAS